MTRAMLDVVAEATGLEQQEIVAQARAGQTLAQIAAAKGADVDDILAQVVAEETARINQAVADGTLEQADADRWLDGLEALVAGMLEQPLQLGGRGAAGGGAGRS